MTCHYMDLQQLQGIKLQQQKHWSFGGNKSIIEAQQEEEQIIKSATDETVTVRHSMDGACFNVVTTMLK